MNLPNSLTVIRIFLVPLLVVVLLTKFEGRAVAGIHVEFVAAAIFGLASLTDWLDGYLARRRQQITWVGQVLDPIADKLLISATLVSLVQTPSVPPRVDYALTDLGRDLLIPVSALGAWAIEHTPCIAAARARFDATEAAQTPQQQRVSAG
jgi:CDP-diacylglycerol--glycerol-3-phosphate 3-phosphatidyltransferase